MAYYKLMTEQIGNGTFELGDEEELEEVGSDSWSEEQQESATTKAPPTKAKGKGTATATAATKRAATKKPTVAPTKGEKKQVLQEESNVSSQPTNTQSTKQHRKTSITPKKQPKQTKEVVEVGGSEEKAKEKAKKKVEKKQSRRTSERLNYATLSDVGVEDVKDEEESKRGVKKSKRNL